LNQYVGGYSHGTRQKLALCGALLPRPSNLLLDEPTVGLDPRAAYIMKETLRQLANEGRTVLLSTHILEIAQGICDRVGIIDHGKLLAVGTVDELRSRSNLQNASLEQLFLQLTEDASLELEAVKQ
jgi:ABC-2 type transport system ATP-binding protein